VFQAEGGIRVRDVTGVQTCALPVSETPTAGYSLLNLGIGTELQSKGRTFCSMHLALNNLADISYQNHLNRLKYTDTNALTGRMGVFNMGRNLSLKLNIPLNFKVAS